MSDSQTHWRTTHNISAEEFVKAARGKGFQRRHWIYDLSAEEFGKDELFD